MSENIGNSSGVDTFVSNGQVIELVGAPTRPTATSGLITYTEQFKPQPPVETLSGLEAGIIAGGLSLLAVGLCILNNPKNRR